MRVFRCEQRYLEADREREREQYNECIFKAFVILFMLQKPHSRLSQPLGSLDRPPPLSSLSVTADSPI